MPGLQRCTEADSRDGRLAAEKEVLYRETAETKEVTMVSTDVFLMIIMGISVENL